MTDSGLVGATDFWTPESEPSSATSLNLGSSLFIVQDSVRTLDKAKEEDLLLSTRFRDPSSAGGENLLVRIHFIIVMIRWTGLAPWEFEFPFPGSLTSTFLAQREELFRFEFLAQLIWVRHSTLPRGGAAAKRLLIQSFTQPPRKVDARLPEKANSNSHGARPIYLIITIDQEVVIKEISLIQPRVGRLHLAVLMTASGLQGG